MAPGRARPLGSVPCRALNKLNGRCRTQANDAPMNVLLQEQILDELELRVLEVAPGCLIVPITDDGEVRGELDDGEALLLRWWGLSRLGFQEVVRDTPRLRWIHTISTGVNHVLFPFLVESDIVLTNARGVYDGSVAEMVLAYMLEVVKELSAFRNLQAERRWQKAFLQELDGLTVGIVGFGGIGQRVAQLARPFGMRIVATKRCPEHGSELADEILPDDRLADLMAQSDFVVVALPLTDQTYHLINAQALAHAKPGAWLINVARGAIIDEPALVQALQKGQLGGACLDVFEDEPLPEDNPLWDLPNAIITPHTSGLSPRLYARSADLFLTNLGRYVAGEPLLNVVDKTAGY